MFAVLQNARKALLSGGAISLPGLKRLRLGIFGLAAMALAACEPVANVLPPSMGGTSGPVKVALLVPYGSSSATDTRLAKNIENAARMAISDLQGADIILQVYPTNGNPAKAAESAVQAVGDGAKVILGPLYAEAANAAGNAVKGTGVNVLAFSNNTEIAGGNVFLLGNTFQNTANRMVRYGVSQGRSKVLVVSATSPAGALGQRAIRNAIRANGATEAGAVTYPFSQEGVVSAVPRIASQAKSAGANAIFFTADTAGALPILTQLLPESGITPGTYQFLGLTRWDVPAASKDLPGLQGGWFALPDPARSGQFNARYNAVNGAEPHPLAGLGYDGIAAVGALAATGKRDAFGAASITRAQGFSGVNGIFRFRPDGGNERGLAIGSIVGGQLKIIDNAPQSFGGAGS